MATAHHLSLTTIFVIALASCTTGPDTHHTEEKTAVARDDGVVLKLANLETIRAEVLPGSPGQALVVITGLLHDGATRVHEVQQQRLADGFVLTVITARPQSAMATLALIPFERSINLDLSGMPTGPCRIMANGLSTTVFVP